MTKITKSKNSNFKSCNITFETNNKFLKTELKILKSGKEFPSIECLVDNESQIKQKDWIFLKGRHLNVSKIMQSNLIDDKNKDILDWVICFLSKSNIRTNNYDFLYTDDKKKVSVNGEISIYYSEPDKGDKSYVNCVLIIEDKDYMKFKKELKKGNTRFFKRLSIQAKFILLDLGGSFCKTIKIPLEQKKNLNGPSYLIFSQQLIWVDF